MSSILAPSLKAEADAYLAAIIDSSDDAIIAKDLNGNITAWNHAAAAIFGYTEAEALGKHISIIIPADRLSEEDFILGNIRQGNRVDHFETVRRRKDGSHVEISVTVSPIKNKDGVVIGASKVARDISKVKLAERTSAYLGAIIESSDDAIIAKDLQGFITSWNKSAERIFGYTAAEIVGKHVTILIPAERLSEEDKILTTLRTGNRVDHFETIRRHKDGHLIPISLTVSPIRDASGKIIGASKISRDISERVAAEEALRESARKKDEFLANMSHELRTPMNAVIGLAGLLKQLDGMPPKAGKFVDTLKTSADHLMNLINDLLDFAKIENESFQIEEVEFGLPEQVEKIISVMNVRAQEKGLSLRVSYKSDFGNGYLGDPLRLHQILMNLLSNAIKFTQEGSVEVDISAAEGASSAEHLVSFAVRDTGIGIAPDKLETVFDKFTQADSSITRKYGGSGLGLAIARACVVKMGGTISVQSQPGIGTTFTFTLPFKNTGKPATVAGIQADKLPAVHGKKNVLLVEDYEPNVLVAAAILELLGYDFDVAQSGWEALRKFSRAKYDLILMDVQMHELDGLEVTRKLRKIESERALDRTPIIAMTAHVREQDKDKCLSAGMDDFIPKPFTLDSLSQKLSTYIRGGKDAAAPEAVPEQA